MTRAHLINRVVGAATQPVVRNTSAWLATAFGHFLQFLGIGTVGCLLLIGTWIAYANGIPWPALKTCLAIAGAVAVTFGVLVIAMQLKLNYRHHDPAVYKDVEAFPQRMPPISYE